MDEIEILFSDVIPIPQDDGPHPVVPIAYSPDFDKCMSLFRAVVVNEEFSERVLKLTAQLIDLSPGHYTVWKYRLDTILNLKLDLATELEFLSSVAESNPKSYQLWRHRQCVLQNWKDPSKEIEFINSILAEDSKNHHAWSYRQWIVGTFNLFRTEINHMDTFLNDDVRNNSAWNHRYFIITNSNTSNDLLSKEVEYAIEKINLAPNNECPWIYIRGIIQFFNANYSEYPEIKQVCVKYTQNLLQPVTFANILLLRIYEKTVADLTIKNSCEDRQLKSDIILKSKNVLNSLIKYDQLRSKYWSYRLSLFDNIA